MIPVCLAYARFLKNETLTSPIGMVLRLPEGDPMFVWSKRLVAGLLGAFVLLIGIFLVQGESETTSGLKIHTTRWMAVNYIGLLVWIFIWMFDQARVRGKNVLLWLVPFALAPLPTLMLFILFLQRKMKS
ncbi:MAG: hypothetical protein OJF47_000990 [Nitrospira sp.]|jgi:hypothetical protein|nr:MAG: hypothetical protein OJF47_000990 [Nitrospira sp.]